MTQIILHTSSNSGGSIMADAFIIDACRTPRGIGKPGKGALAHLHPQHLGATVLAALRDRNDLDTSDVDDIVWGTSSQVSEQSGDLGRMAALDAGYDVKASGVTLDRFCGSGITSTNIAANAIMAGMEDLVISGGTEMMSLPKTGMLPIGANNAHLQELHPQPHQGVCADAIATLDGIGRDALDAHAATSQARAAQAIAEGRFDRSLVPVYNLDGSLRSITRSFRGPAPPPSRSPSCGPRSRLSPTTATPKIPRPTASWSHRSSPISRSSTFTTPATPPVWSTAPPPSCWQARPTPRPTRSSLGPEWWPPPTWATTPR